RDSIGSDWNLMTIPQWSPDPVLFVFGPEDETHPVAAEVPVISATDIFAPLYFAFENSQSGDMEIYASDMIYDENSVRNISQFGGMDRRPVFSEISFVEADSLQARVWLAWERNVNGQWQIWGSYAESWLPGLSVDEKEKNIVSYRLYQNYPNPFNPGTIIGYQLTGSNDVELTIYDILGQPVKNLVKGKQPAGYYEVVWDGKDNAGKEVASGVYLYQIKVGKSIESKKMLLLR
ncbi:MAG: FlgD immunoglobulin-like domain containing protein, partial [Calditrichia bacterium]